MLLQRLLVKRFLLSLHLLLLCQQELEYALPAEQVAVQTVTQRTYTAPTRFRLACEVRSFYATGLTQRHRAIYQHLFYNESANTYHAIGSTVE